MEHIEWYRPSSSGECEIYSQMYTAENPRAIIQIAHGMSERSERYRDFMIFLAENGYIVCANDHLGHGKSRNDEFCVFSNKAGGFNYVIEDMHLLFLEMENKYPNLPLILFGQSMGSIAAALFADRYDYLSKLILMGTPAYNGFIDVLEKGMSLSVKKHGYRHKSKIWNKITGGKLPEDREKKIEHYAWLSSNRKSIEELVDDELCGIEFADSTNLEVMSAIKKWGKQGKTGPWGKNIPDIPILFMAGTEDKVANKGKATEYYYDLLKNTHSKLSLKLVEGNKHEILHETDRAVSYAYILGWLSGT